MKNFFLICIPVLFFGIGSLNAQTKWTKIEYYYNVGSLPPPYHYEYTITVNTDGSGMIHYLAGYTETDSNTFDYTFDLSNSQLKNLKKSVKKSNVLNLDIKSRPNSEIPVGGDSDELSIYGYDENSPDSQVLLKNIPSYPEKKYGKILDKLYKTIKECVPEKIWNEIEERKDNLRNK